MKILPGLLLFPLLFFAVVYLLCRLLSPLNALLYSSLPALLYSDQLWSTLPYIFLLCSVLHHVTVRCLRLYSILLYTTLHYPLAILNQPVTSPMLGWISSTTNIFAWLALKKLQSKVRGTVPNLLDPQDLHHQKTCLKWITFISYLSRKRKKHFLFITLIQSWILTLLRILCFTLKILTLHVLTMRYLDKTK